MARFYMWIQLNRIQYSTIQYNTVGRERKVSASGKTMKETIIVNYEGDKRTDSIGYSAIKQWKLLLESPCCDPDSTDSIQ